MSLCGLRLKKPHEQDELKATLTRQANEGLKLFRTEQRILSAFRCAGRLSTVSEVHIRDIAAMCEQCEWSKTMESDDEEEEDNQRESAGAGSSQAAEKQEGYYNVYDPDEFNPEVSSLRSQLHYNRALDAEGKKSNVAALWRDKTQSSSSSRRGDNNKGSMMDSRFQERSSLGTGVQRRHIRSTVAVHNVLHALATRETVTSELGRVSRHSVREAFSFCVSEGKDTCSLFEFAKLLFLFAAHFFPDLEEEFGHIYVLDRLWDHSLGFFVEEYSVPTLKHIEDRLPIATFPGMDVLSGMYSQVCTLAFTLIGGGSPLTNLDVQRFCEEADVCVAFEHVSMQDVVAAFDFVTNHVVMESSLRNQVPVGMLGERSFLDFLAILGYFAFRMEPKSSMFPTLAAKCEQIILFLHDWYQRRGGHPMEEDIRHPPRDLPQIVSMEPLTVPPTGKEVVVVTGKLFPTHGVYIKFGDWIAISSPMDRYTGQNTVTPPPLDPNRIEILIRTENDLHATTTSAAANETTSLSTASSLSDCIVRRYREVPVSVSIDGIRFNKFHGHKFTFEALDAPVPIGAYLPKLQKIFVHYASNGGQRPADDHITRAEWVQCCRDYRLLPKVPNPDGEEKTEPFLIAMRTFDQYSVQARDKSKLALEGVKPKWIRVLPSHSFNRCMLNCIVSNGQSLQQGIAATLSSDQWIGRESLPDVPEAQLGAHALQIRRAAKGTTISRRPEGVGEKQCNSPRGGRIPLSETDMLMGADMECVVDISGYPKGAWTNEGEHNKMIFRFLTSGDKDLIDDPQLRATAMSSLTYGSKVSVKGIDSINATGSGGNDGNEQSGGGGSMKPGRDAIAEAKDRTRIAVSQTIVVNHRQALNATSRRALDAQERHQRHVARVQSQLDEIKKKNELLEEKVKAAAKLNDEEAPLLHHASGGDGVLRAEKEALHRVFVFELEKRKANLQAQVAREENLRDVERNRVLKEMKDSLVDSDVSFSRLQDVVVGQSETIERQAEVLRLLKDRATILTADVMYYRSAHTKLLSMLSEDPAKIEVLDTATQEKVAHEANVESVLTEMRNEAKVEGKKPPSAIKELAKLAKQKLKARGAADGVDVLNEPLAATDFILPKAPVMKVSLSAEEAEMRTRQAVQELEETKNAEIEALSAQLQALRDRLGSDDDDDEEEGNGDMEGALVSDDDTTHGDRSRRSSSRGSRRGTPKKGCAEIELQTDPIDDFDVRDFHSNGQGSSSHNHLLDQFAQYVNPKAQFVTHHITANDTFESIAQHYGVPVDVLFYANFVTPPNPSQFASEEDMRMELKLLLFGMASRTLRVPTGAAAGSSGSGSGRGGQQGATPLVDSREASSSRQGKGFALPRTPQGVGSIPGTPVAASSSSAAHRASPKGAAAAKMFAAVPPSPGDTPTMVPPLVSAVGSKPPVTPKRQLVSPGAPVSGWDTNRPSSTASSDGFDGFTADATKINKGQSSAAPPPPPPKFHEETLHKIPGMESILDDFVTSPREAIPEFPDAIPVRRTYSLTPETGTRHAEKIVRKTEAQIGQATTQITSAIEAVSSQLMDDSLRLPRDGGDEGNQSGVLPGRDGALETTSSTTPGGDGTPSFSRIKVDNMKQYVSMACAEAKGFQDSFTTSLRDVGAALDANQQQQLAAMPQRHSGPVIKPRKASNITAAKFHKKKNGRTEDKDYEEGGVVSPIQRSLSPSDEHLALLTDPEWLIVVAAPVQNVVQRALSAYQQNDELISLEIQSRLFLKSLRHFGEAELLRRLLIVREAQEFFQACSLRHYLIRSRCEHMSLTHNATLESHHDHDARQSTAERDTMRQQITNADDERRQMEVVVKRRDHQKEAVRLRRELVAQRNAESALDFSKQRRHFADLAKLKKEASSSPTMMMTHRVPKLLAPLSSVDSILTTTKLLGAEAQESATASDHPPPHKSKPPLHSAEATRILTQLLASPHKLQSLLSPLRTAPPPQQQHQQQSSASPVPPQRLPPLAVEHLELVAKAEEKLLSHHHHHKHHYTHTTSFSTTPH